MHLKAAIIFLCCLPVAAAGEEAPSEIEKLVEQLGAERFDTREAAMRKLHDLGGKAYQALSAARKHEEPEVRTRVELLLPLAELLHEHAERVTQHQEAVKTQEAQFAECKARLEQLQKKQQAFEAASADIKAHRVAFPDLFLPAFGAKTPSLAVAQLISPKPHIPEPPPPLDPKEVERLHYTNIEPGKKFLKLTRSGLKDAISDPDTTLRWLANAQDPNGYWDSRCHGAELHADVSQTALALLAYLSCGHSEQVGEYRDNVRRAVRWLKKRQQKYGAVCEVNGAPVDIFSHALAAWALTCASTMGNVTETHTAAKQARSYAEDVLEQWFSEQPGQPAGVSAKASLQAVWFLTLSFRSTRRPPTEESPKLHKLLPRLKAWLNTLENPKTGHFKWTPQDEVSPYATVYAFNVQLWLHAVWPDLAPQPKNEKEADLDVVHERRSTAFKEAVKRCGGFAYGPAWTDVLLNFAQVQNAFHIGGELWKEQQAAMKIQLEASMGRDGAKKGSYPACGLWSGAGTVHTTAWSLLAQTTYYRYLPFR